MKGISAPQPQTCLRPSAYLMYFDTLPIEIFPTIIKYLFLPTDSREDHDVHVSARRQRILSLSMLVSEDSPFRQALSQFSLTELQLGRVSDASRLCMENGVYVIGPELGTAERILHVCGKSVRVVAFSIDPKDLSSQETDNNGVIQKLVALVKGHCPNVEKLSFKPLVSEDNPLPFEDVFPGLLEQFSSQLRSLSWNVIRTHKDCVRLPDISMCTNIRELVFPSSSELMSFLHTSGAFLETLAVSYGDPNGYADILDLIKHNCTRLSKILLWGCFRIMHIVGEERYSNLLCSFGSQLKRALVEGLSVGKLAQVVRACPNLLVPSYLVKEGQADEWERVGYLGPMIKHLTIATGMRRDERCEEAIEKCSNLEALSILRKYVQEERIEGNPDVSYLSSLSSSSLTHFYYYGYTATEQSICVLSSGLNNLSHLMLRLVKPIQRGINFNVITRSNPQLDSVTIFESIDDGEKREKDQSLSVLRMLVNAFSNCRSVNFTLVNNGEEIVSRDEMRDICASLPCRGVDLNITVGSVCYRVRD